MNIIPITQLPPASQENYIHYDLDKLRKVVVIMTGREPETVYEFKQRNGGKLYFAQREGKEEAQQ